MKNFKPNSVYNITNKLNKQSGSLRKKRRKEKETKQAKLFAKKQRKKSTYYSHNIFFFLLICLDFEYIYVCRPITQKLILLL